MAPDPRPSRYIVGLTGGIGSGKSSVATEFARRGADVVDADAVSHALTGAGAPGLVAIRDRLGAHFLRADGELDRPALRAAAFSDPETKRRLESILHPMIGAEIDRQIAQWKGPYGILMVPLLIEGGRYRDRIDRLLVVDCPEEEQVRRVVARSGLDPDEVRAIMRSQVSREARLSAADDVIDNSGPPEAIAPRVAALDAMYRRLAREKGEGGASRTAPGFTGARG